MHAQLPKPSPSSCCRFSEALAMTRQQAAARPGGLSQALGSPPASGAPLSASWEGTRSNWAASGWAGTLGGLTSTGGTGGCLIRQLQEEPS